MGKKRKGRKGVSSNCSDRFWGFLRRKRIDLFYGFGRVLKWFLFLSCMATCCQGKGIETRGSTTFFGTVSCKRKKTKDESLIYRGFFCRDIFPSICTFNKFKFTS